jgi:REP element-mobilizing transposase RayT
MSQIKHLRRQSIRLQGHNYADQGAYFITICTRLRELFFDKRSIRQIAEHCWLEIPAHFQCVELDEWVLMPNHLHGILLINSPFKHDPPLPITGFVSPKKDTLSVIIRTYKAAVTTLCHRAGDNEFTWQRNYYEHIVRNEADLQRIRQYILSNPSMWETDAENPKPRL